ncbi:hypothetical protein TetV_018 [Tetraselmis virus 1]|uniref:Uncharacterized protein n=1 Tax=Tetraselmis virus 1 TaxID=2060617 RepID=A0A2P0VMI8_9VIRU|nr:hypothetical protein QJ968_gp018 [Tetraselmis virus 1]AUF82110.1 hypothetical protein TetV_018 [Tetraselmis virus 1]
MAFFKACKNAFGKGKKDETPVSPVALPERKPASVRIVSMNRYSDIQGRYEVLGENIHAALDALHRGSAKARKSITVEDLRLEDLCAAQYFPKSDAIVTFYEQDEDEKDSIDDAWLKLNFGDHGIGMVESITVSCYAPVDSDTHCFATSAWMASRVMGTTSSIIKVKEEGIFYPYKDLCEVDWCGKEITISFKGLHSYERSLSEIGLSIGDVCNASMK